MHLARQKERLKASAFNKRAFERHTNNYIVPDAMQYNGKFAHSQTYATTNRDTVIATLKPLSQLFLQICNLCNKHNYNDCMSTVCEHCSSLAAFLNAYPTVLAFRKMLKKLQENIFKLRLEKSNCFFLQV